MRIQDWANLISLSRVCAVLLRNNETRLSVESANAGSISTGYKGRRRMKEGVVY